MENRAHRNRKSLSGRVGRSDFSHCHHSSRGGTRSPGAKEDLVEKKKKYDKSFISASNEKPHGEWNEITLTARGGKEAIFELNGKMVNHLGKITYEMDGERVPLSKGRIALQAKYSEMMHRNIRIKELDLDSKPAK
jgi:hypothetical protein